MVCLPVLRRGTLLQRWVPAAMLLLVPLALQHASTRTPHACIPDTLTDRRVWLDQIDVDGVETVRLRGRLVYLLQQATSREFSCCTLGVTGTQCVSCCCVWCVVHARAHGVCRSDVLCNMLDCVCTLS